MFGRWIDIIRGDGQIVEIASYVIKHKSPPLIFSYIAATLEEFGEL
jgi:hypothetical protein